MKHQSSNSRYGLLAGGNWIIDQVKPPRLSERLPSILTDREVDDLIDDLRRRGSFRDLVIFELFLDTGIRLNEGAELTLSRQRVDRREPCDGYLAAGNDNLLAGLNSGEKLGKIGLRRMYGNDRHYALQLSQ